MTPFLSCPDIDDPKFLDDLPFAVQHTHVMQGDLFIFDNANAHEYVFIGIRLLALGTVFPFGLPKQFLDPGQIPGMNAGFDGDGFSLLE